MFPKINPASTSAWAQLLQHADEMKKIHMRQLFSEDADRFSRFSMCVQNLVFDYSRNIITEKTMGLLLQLADECKVKDGIEAMFNGDQINETESRQVLHTALRNFSKEPVFAEGTDVMPDVKKALRKVKNFCTRIHEGGIRGYTGKKFRYIVNIGIGGSDLGPLMVTEALKPYAKNKIETFFVSNVDGSHIAEVLKKVDHQRTLFLVASKTFTTQETMTNANTARQWFLDQAQDEIHIAKHFVALSTNEDEVVKFGISPRNMFTFWDWVGGRFSLWSSIGLSIALTIGFKNFEELLKGAHEVDRHLKETELSQNIPVLMALLSVWYRNFLGASSEAVLPYDQYLHRFPAFLQQGVMESNGKSVDRNGEPVEYATSPVIWGEPGTNGQHAFFQMLHQGTSLIPCDFIGCAQSQNPTGDHHEKLMANFFAQTQALMKGKTETEVQQDLLKTGHTAAEIASLLPYKIFPGNKPSNTILLQKLTPFNLGQLIALYEHKILVQGIIWNIYSFDQWGVELGKQLAGEILMTIKNDEELTNPDSSVIGLIKSFKEMRK